MFVLSGVALVAVVGCSGGGGGGSTPDSSSRSSLAGGRLVFEIPAKADASRGRSRDFLSPSAASVSIAVTGIAMSVVADVSATSSSCTTTGAARTCSIAIAAPVGSDTFTATLYTGANATGTVLGVGTAVQQISAGTAFALTVAVSGTVAKISLQAARKQFTSGVSGSTTIAVSALDAGGNAIAGSYTFPISITDSDTTGTFAISPAVVPHSTTVVTLKYSGGTAATSATISAAGSGVPAANVSAQVVTVGAPNPTPTPSPSPTPTPPPSCAVGSHLYVNDDEGGLVSYALPLTSASVATQLNDIGQNVWIAFDSKKNLYITTYFGPVSEIPPPYTGTAIASSSTGFDGDPYGVAVDASGNVFIAEAENNNVIELSSITGSVVNTITTTGTGPYALALDSAGNLYVGESNGVSEYAPPYTETTPTKSISSVTNTQGIAFDSKGDLFAGGNNEIVVIPPPYTTSKPIATISTGLATPLGLAVDCAGNVYAPNYGNNTITAYAPPYTAGPFATLQGGLPDSDAIGP